MNKPSKEEVEGIIKFLEDQSTIWDGEVPEHSMRIRDYKIMLSILTAYRDGELVEKDRWISVKDNLPELGDQFNVIVDLNDGMDPVASCADWDAIKKEWFYIATEMKMTGVTHWQPLPTPPTEPLRERLEKMEKALKRASFLMQTSGGTAGRDEDMVKLIGEIDQLLTKEG